MFIAGMDKKGKAQYIRWPLSMEAEIEKLAEEEGITKVAMATRLVKMGIEIQKLVDSKFHFRDVRIDPEESEGLSCTEAFTKLSKKEGR